MIRVTRWDAAAHRLKWKLIFSEAPNRISWEVNVCQQVQTLKQQTILPKGDCTCTELFTTSSYELKKRLRQGKSVSSTDIRGETKLLSCTNKRHSVNTGMDRHRQSYYKAIKSLWWTQAPEHSMAVRCLLKNARSFSSKPNYFKYPINSWWYKIAKSIKTKHTCSKVHNLPFIRV